MRKDLVLVSVITPAYNVAPWIGEAVDSVLAQTHRRFEYVVVDDGSTDDTAGIVLAKSKKDSRVRLVQTANRGSAAARNAGLAESIAPFVAFLDGDDRWNPHFLRHSLNALCAAPATVGATYVHTRVMLDRGCPVSLRWQPAGSVDLDRMLIANCPPHNGSSLLVRRSCFDEVGGFDPGLRSCTDFEMWLRIGAWASTPTFLGLRRYDVDMRLMRPGSISSNRTARFEMLEQVVSRYAPLMARRHPGLAWIRPAVFAYRDGHDGWGDSWSERARAAGTAALARDGWGRALLTWSAAGREGRAQLRALRDTTRAGMYQCLGAALRAVQP